KMQPWVVLILLLPLASSDVSHLHNENGADSKETQKDPSSSGFYPSVGPGLALPPGYAIPTGGNVPPPPAQPPNFPLPIYPPFFGFGGGPGEQGPAIGPVPSAYPNGGAVFPGAGAPSAAIQQPPGPPGAFPSGGVGGSFGGQGAGVGFPQQGAGFPPQGVGFPPQGAGFPPQGAGFPPQGAGFPPQGAGFPPQGAGFPPQGPGFPSQGPGFPPQGGFPPQSGPFPPQGVPFPPQGGPGDAFPGAPFPGSPFPDFLTNQGLPLANSQGPFQGPNPAGFNVPVGFGGPLPGQNPYQQFGPGFGGPAPPGYSDEPEPQPEQEPEQAKVEPPPANEAVAEDAKSGADTVYASNGGYVYQRAK
ncbi:hypothetical protein KR032_004799, partial [Drosophila birchii]